jgi:hypothetical protein
LVWEKKKEAIERDLGSFIHGVRVDVRTTIAAGATVGVRRGIRAHVTKQAGRVDLVGSLF